MAMPQSDVNELRILLVEDSSEARKLVRDMLTSIGYQNVFTARDGRHALDMLNDLDGEDLVDVVLCDWNMPRVSGLELLRQIRTYDAELPFIMITGEVGDDSIREARSSGATTCLKKPFSEEDLSRKMRAVERMVSARA